MGLQRVGHDWVTELNWIPTWPSVHISCSVMSDSCDPLDCSTLGFCIYHQLTVVAQTHVHQFGDAIQPSHPLSSPSSDCCLQSFRVFSNESVLCIRWPKFWSFSFSISPSSEYSGLISLELAGLISLEFKGRSRVFSKSSSKASVLQCSAFYIVQLSHPSMTTGKTTVLTRWTFVSKVMSLLFNMLSRLVITFILR